MSNPQKHFIGALAASLLALFFALAYGVIIFQTATATTTYTVPAVLEKVIGMLSVGVGGVIAFWFGIAAPTALLFSSRLARLGSAVAPKSADENIRFILGLVYVGVYFAVSAIGFVLWLLNPAQTPEILQAQVVAGVGLLIGIGAGFLKQ